MKRRTFLGSFAALAASGFISSANAAWPERNITAIVPFPPGGGLDLSARVIGPILHKELGQPFVILNRPGATGSIGTLAVARSEPDGYNLLWGSLTSTAIFAALYRDTVQFDLNKDFSQVSVFGTVPFAFVVNPSIKAHSVSELIALAKAKPGSITFATSGHGSIQHLAAERFQRAAGVEMLHIPYKGIGPAMVDLLAGQVDMAIESLSAVMPYVKSGKLRALAVTTKERFILTAEIPTASEAGLKDFELGANLFVAAPAGTPQQVLAKVNEAMNAAVGRLEVKENLLNQAVVLKPSSLTEATKLVRDETAMWLDLIKSANIRPQ